MHKQIIPHGNGLVFGDEVLNDCLGKPEFSMITKFFDEGNNLFMIRWFNKFLIVDSRANLKNITKDFYSNFETVVIQLKFVRRRILDLDDNESELMHIDLRDISSD
ncbi:hypothetical protein Tco_0599923 [Tanacetum coccineum]